MKHLLLTTIAAVVLVGTAFADPIHDAAKSGDIAGVQAELDKGVDVNAKREGGSTSLHGAAEGGHGEIVKLLISAGADLHARTVPMLGGGGWTPLHSAARQGHREIVELLIANGSDVNSRDSSGKSSLHDAALEGHKEIVELLIIKGADLNTESGYYGTPLHVAAGIGHEEIVELLIANGANVNVKDGFGRTPLDAAELVYEWDSLDFVVHSLAHSDRNELKGRYVATSRANFLRTLSISCFSFTEVAKESSKIMGKGSSMLTLTYESSKVIPNYNVMGVCKAALETSVKYLARDLGSKGIRVNAISAGPIKTLAASAIGDTKLNAFQPNPDDPALELVGNKTPITLKNVQFSEWASQETHHFQATVYMDGKRAMKVSNEGHGSCHNYYHTHGQSREAFMEQFHRAIRIGNDYVRGQESKEEWDKLQTGEEIDVKTIVIGIKHLVENTSSSTTKKGDK